MIISHKYKYLFIEIPLTGSWAIHHELCNHYDGSPILHKHATYPEFLRISNEDEKKYFVFATIRNPLDECVSGYFKFITDHKNAFSDADISLELNLIDYTDLYSYQRLKSLDADFESSFMSPRIWERPYSNMIEISYDYIDFVIRYESLSNDFEEVLRILGIHQIRPLPVVNKTQGRESDWTSYYTPQMIEKAKVIYGPFMEKWGYEFPSTWGEHKVSWRKNFEFQIVNQMKKLYLIHLRYNDKNYSKLIRKLHAYLKTYIYR